MHPLIAIVGPTGSGKSALALSVAAQGRGEIINCDSVQVYSGLDIGSAKTPVPERLGLPHHLIDVVSPGGEMTAGDYARRAAEVLLGVKQRGHLPVIVGGTGFYLRAALEGLSPAPERNQPLRDRLARVAQRRPVALHRFLRTRDPDAARRIHPNDHQKLIRAIEMAGQIQPERQALAGFRVLKIGLNPPRAELYERINRRCRWMFENGLLEETRALLAAGIAPGAKALTTLGYRQAIAVITHNLPVEDAICDCQLRTRHYAKRQLTWFRAEADVHWLTGFGDNPEIQQAAFALLK